MVVPLSGNQQYMDAVIKVSGLTKQFGPIRAVDDLSFQVPAGEVYGFLGQNGAGKSTTIRMLVSLIRPTGGEIEIMGKLLREERGAVLQQVGAIIERPDLYNYLSALENLRIMARLNGLSFSTKELVDQLERVGLAERAHGKVKTFSQGMKQRLGIACALIHNPSLIILDEPTNGLDPQGIADMRNLILHLAREQKKTVFISSHLLSELEVMADSMLIIDKGKKVKEGRVADLLNPNDTLVAVQTLHDDAALKILQDSAWSSRIQPARGILLRMHKNEIPVLNRFLVEQHVEVSAMQPRHSLEDYFLSLTTENQHVVPYKY